jgi:hypothetical protein
MKRFCLALLVCSGCVAENGGFIELLDNGGSGASLVARFARFPGDATRSQVSCLGRVGGTGADGGVAPICTTITCHHEQIGPCQVIECESADGGMPQADIAADSAGLMSITITQPSGPMGKLGGFTSPPMTVPPCSSPRLCRSSSDCGGIGNQICQNGACQTCQSNNDCGSTGICDSGQCTNCAAGQVYYNGISTFSLWSGGETLTVAASGEKVPGFSSSIVAPSSISFSPPNFAVRTKDLDLTWSGGDHGALAIGLNTNCDSAFFGTPFANNVAAVCELPGAAHEGTIPSAVLTKFPSGQSASYNACSRSRSMFSAGGWDVSLVVVTPITDGNIELE